MQINNHNFITASFFGTVFILFLTIINTKAIPISENGEKVPSIDEFVQLLRKSYDYQSKRGLDLGFHRGHSGMMTAKYLAGINMAGPMGPGRKRSSPVSTTSMEHNNLDYDIEPIAYQYNNYLDNLLGNSNGQHPKRGLDFGFGRGLSGLQTAKHLIGMEEANDAMGPGRRRRATQQATIQQNSLENRTL